MDGKDQIIQLGKVLAEEQRRGCDDGAAEGGLERFLTGWRLAADGALQHTPVQQALELLSGYAMFDATTRRARVGIALEGLRSLFREVAQGPATDGQRRAAGGRPAAPPTSKAATAAPAQPLTLETPIEQLPGVGKVTAQAFRRLGVRTVEQMLYHFPH